MGTTSEPDCCSFLVCGRPHFAPEEALVISRQFSRLAVCKPRHPTRNGDQETQKCAIHAWPRRVCCFSPLPCPPSHRRTRKTRRTHKNRPLRCSTQSGTGW